METRFIVHTNIKLNGHADEMCREAWEDFFADLQCMFDIYDSDGAAFVRCDDIDWGSILLFGKADLEQEVHWGVPGYAYVDEVCSDCLANRTDKPFTDLRDTAEWVPTQDFDHETFMDRTHGNHPLVTSIYWNRFFVRIDMMHVFDHKGITGIVCAGVLVDVVKNCTDLGRTIDERLQWVNAKLSDWNSRHVVSSRINNLKIDNLEFGGATQWATLRGPLVKAANTRNLAPFVCSLAHELYGSRVDAWGKSIVGVTSELCHIYDIVYSGPMFLPAATRAELRCATFSFGRHLMMLRQLSAARGDLYFQVTPKCHMGMHIASQACLLNPRFVQVYGEESLVGRLAKIWSASAQGRYQRTIQKTVLLKYLVAMAIILEL